jgi:hypothetical protein
MDSQKHCEVDATATVVREWRKALKQSFYASKYVLIALEI